jgi:hypothetical protein
MSKGRKKHAARNKRRSSSIPAPPVAASSQESAGVEEESTRAEATGGTGDELAQDDATQDEHALEAQPSEEPIHEAEARAEESADQEASSSLAPVETSHAGDEREAAHEEDDGHQPATDEEHDEHEEHEGAYVTHLGPRRGRGFAFALIGVAAAAALAVGVKVVRNGASRASRTAAATVVAPTPAPVEAPKPAAAKPVEPAPSALAVATAQAAPSAAATVDAKPEDKPADKASDKASGDKAGDANVTDARALRDEALKLLEKAKNPEAMAAASKALDADPTDAMPYLVMGSALQDAGRWREATRAYQLCTKTATKGMVDECRAMLHRR